MTATLELVCPACQSVELCGPTQMLARLRSLSLLRRDNAPALDLLQELFRSSADRFTCHDCNATGLVVREVDERAWGMAKKCEDCGAPIAAERLEIFPDAARCMTCEQQAARGGGGEREFCPRCGEVLQLRLRSATGLSRYQLTCPRCR